MVKKVKILYDIRQCAHNLKRYFGKEGIWRSDWTVS